MVEASEPVVRDANLGVSFVFEAKNDEPTTVIAQRSNMSSEVGLCYSIVGIYI